jgi:hypothetical protein
LVEDVGFQDTNSLFGWITALLAFCYGIRFCKYFCNKQLEEQEEMGISSLSQVEQKISLKQSIKQSLVFPGHKESAKLYNNSISSQKDKVS